MTIETIAAATSAAPALLSPEAPCSAITQAPAQAQGPSFADMLMSGAQNVEARIERADQLVNAFALGDDVPIHQVTIALEEARIAVEFAVQVRTRLIESYREIMNMQL